MIIDDERLFGDLMLDIFAGDNIQITCVHSGRDALTQPKQDLYIVDYRLPGINGLETLSALQQKFNGALSAFLTTGYNVKFDEQMLQKHGIIEILQKPFDMARLKKLIHDFFAARCVEHP